MADVSNQAGACITAISSYKDILVPEHITLAITNNEVRVVNH